MSQPEPTPTRVEVSGQPDIAVVIPFFQRNKGLLSKAVQSAFAQTQSHRLLVIIADDSSPIPAADEVAEMTGVDKARIIVSRKPNGGAGAARNRALSLVPKGVKYVAFLDSDDEWWPHHIESATRALERGYDAYFADFIAVGFPGIGNMARIGTLKSEEHKLIDAKLGLHELSVTPIEHMTSDGGGLIQTSTVVYRFDRFADLRFREEFFNGQDFFFWMDLGERAAKFAFSFDIECSNGEGINIYQASGWGTEKSLQRIRNELFVWTSVNRFYQLKPTVARANQRTVRELQKSAGLDILHRLRHGKPVSSKLVRSIVDISPSTIWFAPKAIVSIALNKLLRR